MRYYRKKPYNPANRKNKNESLCWNCKNCFGGCSWSKDFAPVEGWKATETYIPMNGEHAQSYKVIECPQYIIDK